MAEVTPPAEEIVLAHFIVSDDVERSRRFYTEVLGGKLVFSGDVTYVALANSWIIINVGGGPTDDKPTVTLETPRDPDKVSSFLNIRVKDIHAVYAEWSARGAQFLTPPTSAIPTVTSSKWGKPPIHQETGRSGCHPPRRHKDG
jgi:catechol 2,3-dioxygenase-like lactoylglutathione lyase family enzyme